MRALRQVCATVSLGMLLLCGCAEETGTSPDTGAGASRDLFAGADYDAVFDAGRSAAAQWFHIDQSRADIGRITTLPAESDERGGTGRIRDETIRYQNRVRRSATLRIHPQGDAVVVECVVVLERLDTADHRTFAQQRTFNEQPTATPVTGEAGVSARQSEAWTEVGRDRGMERKILDSIRMRVQGPRSATASRPAIQP